METFENAVRYFDWFKAHVVPGVLSAGRCNTVLSPLTVCSSTMAAVGPEDRAGAGPGGTAACPSGLQACVSTTTQNSNGPDRQQTLVSGRRAAGLPFRVTEMTDVCFHMCCITLFVLSVIQPSICTVTVYASIQSSRQFG